MRKKNKTDHSYVIAKNIAKTLILHRVWKGYTQQNIGDAVGLTFQQIQKYEMGMNNIGLEKFYDLCQLYNIPDNLIGDLLRQFKETPNANDVVASPKILQVIDGGKYE